MLALRTALLALLALFFFAGCAKKAPINANYSGLASGLDINQDDGTAKKRTDGTGADLGYSTCSLRMNSPQELIFEPGRNASNSTEVEIWDAEVPNSAHKKINPITPRLIMVDPQGPKFHFMAKYTADPASVPFSCEVAGTVPQQSGPSGGPSGTNIIIIIKSVFTPPPAPPQGTPVLEQPPPIPFGLFPACSNWRRTGGKQVAYDMYPTTEPAKTKRSKQRVLLSFRTKQELLFARYFPHVKEFFDGGYYQPIPQLLVHTFPDDTIEVRMCIREFPTDRPLIDSDFDCADVTANYQIGTGRKTKDKDVQYLTQSVAKFTKQQLLNGAHIEFWNRRGKADGVSCLHQYSPLVLDILGNGIKTVSAENSGVTFDLTAGGDKTKVGWIAPDATDNAFLVMDRNHNGIIDNGTELFGEYTGSTDGEQTYETGFDALKPLDTNGDGKISAEDASWKDLRLWFAAGFKSTAASPKPVLQKLDDIHLDGKTYRIKYIDLTYYQLEFEGQPTFQNGNNFTFGSHFMLETADGNVLRNIVDIFFGAK